MDIDEIALGPYRPDLVIGLVVPVGTPIPGVRDSLARALKSYGYEPHLVKLSRLLESRAPDFNITVPREPENERIEALMNVGDALCSSACSAAAVLWEAVAEIGLQRAILRDDERRAEGTPVSRAWVLESLKRPEEVAQLRRIYGDHAIILAVTANVETRTKTLAASIAPRRPAKTDEDTSALISQLVARDKDDPENLTDGFGQNILKTFPLADCFIDCDSDVRHQVDRLVDLLFASPRAETPTIDEYGMYVANATGSLSPELGLKVGAAILRERSIVATGMNSHPLLNDLSPAYDRSKLDIARLALDSLRRLDKHGLLTPNARAELEANPDEFVSGLLKGALKGSQIASLTEFQVPVHAEMSALLDALSQSKPVSGAKLYVTAYPCHNCAKHLLRAGLSGLYIEPYPKSRAEAMYGHDARDAFRPYIGVAPSQYLRMYGPHGDRMGREGQWLPWDEEQRFSAEPVVAVIDPLLIRANEDDAAGQRAGMPGETKCQTNDV